MRVYDGGNETEVTDVTIYLTPDEATEVASRAQHLYDHPETHRTHLSSHDFSRQITLAVYAPDNIDQFDETSRAIVGDDWKRPPTRPRRLAGSKTIPIRDDREEWLSGFRNRPAE